MAVGHGQCHFLVLDPLFQVPRSDGVAAAYQIQLLILLTERCSGRQRPSLGNLVNSSQNAQIGYNLTFFEILKWIPIGATASFPLVPYRLPAELADHTPSGVCPVRRTYEIM